MSGYNHCISHTTDSMVKVEENARKAVFRNKSRQQYKVIKIDGCLIKDGIRCDYLVTREQSESVYVELKGVDIQHACDQLLASAKNGVAKQNAPGSLGFLVICKRFPRFDTYVAKAKTYCAKHYRAGFHVVCDRGEFDIDRVTAIDGPY